MRERERRKRNKRTDQFRNFCKVVVADGSGDELSLVMRLVESEWRRSDHIGDIPWDFEPRLERGLQTKPKKRWKDEPYLRTVLSFLRLTFERVRMG